MKWRRAKKRPNRFNFFRVLTGAKDKKAPKVFRIKDSKVRRHTRTYLYRVPKIDNEEKWEEPKPLIDVLEEEDEVVVVTEFAGFESQNLRTDVKNQRLTLYAEALDRKYHKSLNLPARVIPDTLRITYKNGVLEIRLKKAVKEKAIDKIVG